jgi:hypothetical protein
MRMTLGTACDGPAFIDVTWGGLREAELLERRMSCGFGRGNCGRAGMMLLMRLSGQFIVTSVTASTAWAQQPQVTQVGGQALSSLPAGSLAVHGSALTRPTTPDALNVSNETMMARANRRTRSKCNIQARRSRHGRGRGVNHRFRYSVAPVRSVPAHRNAM